MSTLSITNIKNRLSQTNAIEIDSNNNVVFRADMTILGTATIGNMSIGQDFTVGDQLTVNGNTILGNAPTDTLTVSGAATIGSSLGVTGNTELGGSLSVVGATSIAGLTYTGTLTGGTGVINIGGGQFVKDAAGDIGINVAAPTSRLTIGQGTFDAAGVGTSGLYTAASGLLTVITDGFDISTRAGVNRFTLDTSGNLGLGGAPGSGFKQEIFGSSVATPATTASQLSLRELGNVTALNFVAANEGGTLVQRVFSSTSLAFGSNGVERLRIDSAGNAGLGVTPSAWRTADRAFQVRTTILENVNNISSSYGLNYYRDSLAVDRYISNNFAGQIVINASNNGSIAFNTAPSGTAGNPITFTQAMTLAQNGNLLVGTTGDTGIRLNVAAPTGTTIADFSNQADANFAIKTVSGTVTVGPSAGANLAFQTGGNEKARITSGGYFKASNNGLYNGPTELFHEFRGNGASFVVVEDFTGAAGTGSCVHLSQNIVANGATLLYAGRNGTTTNVYQVLANGNVQNTNNSFGAISDAKLKENVVDTPDILSKFMNVRFRNFNLIGSDLKQFGVIAQELEAVFPSLVEETPDVDEKGNSLGTVTKSVKYSVLALMAGKVIQEQQKVIEAQQATIDSILERLAALEAK